MTTTLGTLGTMPEQGPRSEVIAHSFERTLVLSLPDETNPNRKDWFELLALKLDPISGSRNQKVFRIHRDELAKILQLVHDA